MAKRYKAKGMNVRWGAVIAVIMALIIGAGVCCMGYASRDVNGAWFRNSDLSTWHWDDVADGTPPDGGDHTGGGDNVNGGDDTDDVTPAGEEAGLQVTPKPQDDEEIRLTATRALETNAYSENSFTLTATIKPTIATNTQIEWGVAWQNANSGWANGKSVTDYVTVTPTSDGSATARVDCKADFGEKILVTATSRDDESKSATCVCDYRKRLIDVRVKFSNESGVGGWMSDNEEEITVLKLYRGSDASTNYKLQMDIQQTNGTINNRFEDYRFYLYGTPKMQELINNRGDIYGSTPQVKTEKTSSSIDSILNADYSAVFDTDFFMDHVVYMDLDWYEDDYTAACNLLISNLSKDCGALAVLEPTFEFKCNGEVLKYKYKAALDMSAVKIAVDDIELDKPSWEF